MGLGNKCWKCDSFDHNICGNNIRSGISELGQYQLALFLGYDIQINHSIYHQTLDQLMWYRRHRLIQTFFWNPEDYQKSFQMVVKCLSVFRQLFFQASVFTTNCLCTLSFGPSENMTVFINVFLTETYNSGGYFVQKLKSDSFFPIMSMT